MVIFHSYVQLPEGNRFGDQKSGSKTKNCKLDHQNWGRKLQFNSGVPSFGPFLWDSWSPWFQLELWGSDHCSQALHVLDPDTKPALQQCGWFVPRAPWALVEMFQKFPELGRPRLMAFLHLHKDIYRIYQVVINGKSNGRFQMVSRWFSSLKSNVGKLCRVP